MYCSAICLLTHNDALWWRAGFLQGTQTVYYEGRLFEMNSLYMCYLNLDGQLAKVLLSPLYRVSV